MIIPNSEKHRRTIRLDGYNYSNVGAYFVTICTKNGICVLGKIDNGEVKLSPIGETAKKFWLEIPKHFQNVELDEFVIMPNHIHGIIIIYECRGGVTPPLHKPTLGQVVAYFKYQSTKVINRRRNTPGQPFWQRNYYEHIIRNKKSLERIQEYIHYNPQSCELDRENPNRIGKDEFDEWLYGKDNQ